MDRGHLPPVADGQAEASAPVQAPLTGRGEQTRTAILEVALTMFRERGYDATTMRAIAAGAGVSLGNAYYYFPSKEHLIQGYYVRLGDEHRAAAAALLANERDLERRIVGVLECGLDQMEPYRTFAGKFFRHAAEPTSPLSPFSNESAPARTAAIALWREVVEGSDTKVAKAVADDLPELLWLYFMGHILFWVHDPSEDAARTRHLVRRTAPFVVRAIGLARLPVLRGTIEDLVGLVGELRHL